jgi:hypothetical protein
VIPEASGRVRSFGHARACGAPGPERVGAEFIGAQFLDRYRRRAFLPYLPPPAWVGSVPLHAAGEHVALFTVDEMGKSNFLPIVCDDDYPPDVVARLISPLLLDPVPGPREVRLIGDDEVMRTTLSGLGFRMDRVQHAMSMAVPRRPAEPPTVEVLSGSSVGDEELAAHHNLCFGLRMTAYDVARMRDHADWSDRNLFACRDGAGDLVAVLRLVLDAFPDATPYGLLRGLAVHPRHRRDSLAILTALYFAAMERAADAGARRCHLLVDADPAGGRRTAAPMFEFLGFRTETVMYRMRQAPSSTPA